MQQQRRLDYWLALAERVRRAGLLSKKSSHSADIEGEKVVFAASSILGWIATFGVIGVFRDFGDNLREFVQTRDHASA